MDGSLYVNCSKVGAIVFYDSLMSSSIMGSGQNCRNQNLQIVKLRFTAGTTASVLAVETIKNQLKFH